ncbi:MAG: phytanoyl-CoA dioxygenase family protein [Myxococcota bacterium]
MTELVRLPATATPDEIVPIVQRDGALILEDVLASTQVDQALRELTPYIDATRPGHDDFSGRHTTRTGALVARSAASREMVLHPGVLASARQFLAPWCDRIQLHLSQVIRILPGEKAQRIHRDRWAWGTHLSGLEPQFNTIWALTDFEAKNGATQVVPGSVGWKDGRVPEPSEIRRAEMSAGSVLVYSGSVYHGGGANESDGPRIGANMTYTLGWLRQEENQYLSCPPEIAREFPKELQELIGYAMGSYALGYYTPPLPPGEGPESVGPEFALGQGGDAYRLGSDELYEKLNDQIRAARDR